MPELKYNFLDSDNYTFDPTKIENVGPGTFKLLATVAPGTAYLYTKLDEGVGLVARDSAGNVVNRDGAFQGFLTETDWSTAGKFGNGIEGNDTGIINFDGFGGFEHTEAFSIAYWINLVNSASSQAIVAKQKNTGVFEGWISNAVSGVIRWVIRDTDSKVNTIETNSSYAGALHQVVCTYDGSGDANGMHLYVDNALDENITNNNTMTGTIKNTANLQISGRNGANDSLRTGTIINDVMIFNRELSAAEVAFLWNGGAGIQQLPGAGTSFPTDNPTIQAKNGFEATELKNFLATVVETGNDKVKFVISVNNVDKWWNGAAIADSIGYTESNTAAEILANIAAFLDGTKARVNPKSFLHSDTGSSTPEISDLTIGYDAKTAVISLQTSEVSSILLDAEGSPIVGRTVKTRMAYNIGTNIITTSDYVSTVSDPTGAWSLTLQIEDIEPDFLEWCINGKFYKTNFLLGLIKFSDLTIIEENNTL